MKWVHSTEQDSAVHTICPGSGRQEPRLHLSLRESGRKWGTPWHEAFELANWHFRYLSSDLPSALRDIATSTLVNSTFSWPLSLPYWVPPRTRPFC